MTCPKCGGNMEMVLRVSEHRVYKGSDIVGEQVAITKDQARIAVCVDCDREEELEDA